MFKYHNSYVLIRFLLLPPLTVTVSFIKDSAILAVNTATLCQEIYCSGGKRKKKIKINTIPSPI